MHTIVAEAIARKVGRAIVHEFIDRIIVHEPEQAQGDRRQKVEIIYNNAGAVDRLALMGLGA